MACDLVGRPPLDRLGTVVPGGEYSSSTTGPPVVMERTSGQSAISYALASKSRISKSSIRPGGGPTMMTAAGI
jgi:hypothetical protein